MANRTATLALVLMMTALVSFPAAALEAPRPVAPAPDGDDSIALVRGGCPSFHWAGVEGAKHYDLTVFEVRSDGEPVECYRIQVPGAAGSWAPGAERCLDPGSEYAWSLRALGADGTPGPWSSAVLFRVEAEPLPPAVARELAALRAAAAGGSAGSDLGGSEARKPGAGKQSTGEARSDDPAAALTPPGTSAVGPPTEVGIHGMVEAPGDGATGIFGSAAATSGATVGVRGEVASAAGTAGVFENLAGGPILVGRSGGAARFSVDGVGTVYADGHVIAAETFHGDGSGLENVNADQLGTVAAADYALESEVMDIVLANDGEGSGLDAHSLGGLDPYQYVRYRGYLGVRLAITHDHVTSFGHDSIDTCFGYQNSAFGSEVMPSLDCSGDSIEDQPVGNTGIGFRALHGLRRGQLNTILGGQAGGSIDTGSMNTGLGFRALQNLGSGSGNIAIGYEAGDNLAGIENDNILIGNRGSALESSAIRIGRPGTHTVASIAGDLGIGTADPLNRFHAMAGIDGPGTPGNHVALIENWQIGGPDVLALKVGEPGHLEGDTNFITFFNGDDESKGAIQGNGASGVALVGPGNDFAEWLEKREPAEELAPGQVVGVFGGQVSLETDGADRVMVVSTDPIVVGNDPGEDARPGWARIALIGQAQVRVRGPAGPGDLLVASGAGDGRAVAVSPQDVTIDQLHLAIGRVVHGPESVHNGEARVRAFVGLPDALSQRTLGSMVRAMAERMARQESELREIRAELQALESEPRQARAPTQGAMSPGAGRH